jgi:hypothetical protein
VSRTETPTDDSAITLALAALSHMARDDALSARFLGESGMNPADIAGQAADPEFLAAVLDFFLSDEGALLGFAAEAGLAPERIAAARRGLPGGTLPHWT